MGAAATSTPPKAAQAPPAAAGHGVHGVSAVESEEGSGSDVDVDLRGLWPMPPPVDFSRFSEQLIFLRALGGYQKYPWDPEGYEQLPPRPRGFKITPGALG